MQPYLPILLQDKRRQRQNYIAFSKLIANPFSMGSCLVNQSLTAFFLPASAVLEFSHSAITSINHIIVVITGPARLIRLQGAPAGWGQYIGYIEKGKRVQVSRLIGPNGTVSISIISPSGLRKVIATGIFN